MSLTPIKADHADLLEYKATQRLENERRFSVLGCPWQCDNGWRVVEDKGAVPHPFEVVKDGVLYTPCECNCRLVWRNGRYESEVIDCTPIKTS